MAVEKSVCLYRDPDMDLGFSLLGTPHLPPIIYDILENSPAAVSGEVEAGDVIVKINEVEVGRYTTKEGIFLVVNGSQLSSKYLTERKTVKFNACVKFRSDRVLEVFIAWMHRPRPAGRILVARRQQK